MNKIHTQDRLSGEKFKFLTISKHQSLVKLGVVWFNVKTYQTDCPVNNINFRIDCCCLNVVNVLKKAKWPKALLK